MKTIKYLIVCTYILSAFFTFHANAQEEGCNLVINLDNSNCNDNTLIGGGGCSSCHHDAPCGCKDAGCCDCLEVRFNTEFAVIIDEESFAGFPIIIRPFVQEPNCKISFGDGLNYADIPLGATTAILNECLKVCLRCNGVYTIGYIIELDLQMFGFSAFQGSSVETVGVIEGNDSICVCGKNIRLPTINGNELFVMGSWSSKVLISCCECPPKSCAGCSCLNNDCSFPFANELIMEEGPPPGP